MRRFSVVLWVLFGVALITGGAWLLGSRSDEAPAAQRDSRPVIPEFAPVAVRARPGQQALTLTGTVRAPSGAAIANAEVFLAASTQRSLTTGRCGICEQPLLSCRAHETTRAVAQVLEAGRGDVTAALSTRSAADGRFRFEQLAGTSFMVWARAAGHGEGIKERAAPGDPVELYLPLPRSITGTLKDEAGAPVTGTVRALSRRLAHVVETTAGADGRFALRNLGEGPFYVLANAPGRLPAARDQVEAGPELVVLGLPSPRRLEVRLLAQGRPVEGVVMLQGNHLARELVAKGGFVGIAALYPGELMVVGVAGALSSAPARVTLAAPVTSLTLNLERGGRLAVTVIDEGGQPIATPTVELLTRNGELVAKRALQTGELGQFGPIGAGDYQLRASSEAFQTATLPAAVKAGSEAAIEVTLTRGALIAGQVIDEYGRPAPGVSVLVTPTGDSIMADAEGHFRAGVPSPGLYTLQAHHSDWGGGEVTVTAPKLDVELQLEPKSGAEVTVTIEGRRVEGAQVVLFHAGGDYRSDRPSGADGVVLMRGLPPGDYTLEAKHKDYLPSYLQPLALQDGQVVKVDAALGPGGAVTGQVVDTKGAPVPGVPVVVSPRGAEPNTTDGSGRFSISPLRPKAQYSVRVVQRGVDQVERVRATAGGEPVRIVVARQPVFRGRVLGEGLPLKSFRVDAQEVNSPDGRFEVALRPTGGRVMVAIEAPGFDPLTVERPDTVELGDFELMRAPLVTGLVHEAGGAPVSDAVVTCDSCEQSVLSGADGRFALGRPAFQHQFKLTATKGRRTATRLVNAQAPGEVDLELQPGVRLSGTAYLANGQPAAGAEISATNADRSQPLSVVTNADGSYATEVPAGTYRFVLLTRQAVQDSEDALALFIDVQGAEAKLDFGPVPGMGVITVRLSPQPGYALWLVRGEPRAFGNPPMELLGSSWAQLVYQPRGPRLTFGGLSPGRYTLVWANYHATTPEGPIAVSVDVPTSAEVTLVR
jgi:hypothetical protein